MTPREKAILAATVFENPYIPQKPFKKQRAFLAYVDFIEGFYGGSAGPGKSSGLLMAALQYVEEPNYSALLLRRTYKDLALPGALLSRSQEWLHGKAHWNELEKTWTFPSGATLTFGYLENENDKFRYQGAEFQFIGFDELTQFTESQYLYLFSRLRRLENSDIPLRMRSASNPGGVGHIWVKQRFIVPNEQELKTEGRFFIRALMGDNPYLDQKSYEESLAKLDYVTREQLKSGNWDIHSSGIFKRGWFEIIDQAPAGKRRVRYWDLAATAEKAGKDPDWTVGALLTEHEGQYFIIDLKRVRATPGGVENLIRQTAELDGRGVEIAMEQEPGSSGVNTIDHYTRVVLKGFSFRGQRSTGSKIERAAPVSSAAEAGNIKIIKGAWINNFLDEIESFPTGPHDDQIDAVSGAFGILSISNDIDYEPGEGFEMFRGVPQSY
jgi:predicted phage terminase large subunit-like protein